METDLMKEYFEKLDDKHFLLIRNYAGRTLILDSTDELNIRGEDYVEFKTCDMEFIQHKDTIVAMQISSKDEFIENFFKEMVEDIIEIRND